MIRKLLLGDHCGSAPRCLSSTALLVSPRFPHIVLSGLAFSGFVNLARLAFFFTFALPGLTFAGFSFLLDLFYLFIYSNYTFAK